MGVDYSPVGGVGIEVTKEIKKKLVVANDGDYEDMNSLLDALELPYKEAGSGNYTGKDNTFYLVVEGDTLNEVNENAQDFIDSLAKLGVVVTMDDLKIIEELHVW